MTECEECKKLRRVNFNQRNELHNLNKHNAVLQKVIELLATRPGSGCQARDFVKKPDHLFEAIVVLIVMLGVVYMTLKS